MGALSVSYWGMSQLECLIMGHGTPIAGVKEGEFLYWGALYIDIPIPADVFCESFHILSIFIWQKRLFYKVHKKFFGVFKFLLCVKA